MPTNPWPGGAVSLILLPDGDIGDQILKQAIAWTRSGLLSPALWTQPSMVKASDYTSLSVVSTIPGQRFSEQGDAIRIIANTEFSLIRLIALRTLFPPIQKNLETYTADLEQLRALEELARLLQVTLPEYPGTVRKEEDVRLTKINLIAAPPWASEISDNNIIQPEWDWNVLMSLENRLTPFSTDAILRPDQGFIGAVLSNAATVSGIWRGVPRSSLELISQEASSNHGKLWVHRAFVRGVIKEGVVTQVTAEVLRQISNPDFDVFDSVDGIAPKDVQPVGKQNIDAYVDLMVVSTVDLQAAVMLYKRPPQYVDPSKVKISFAKQLKDFFAFTWDKLKLLPLMIVRAIVEAFNRLVNRVFQGRDGRAEVDLKEDIAPLKNDKRDMRVFSGINELISSVEDFQSQRSKRSKVIVEQKLPSAELWKEVRQLVFAALDGSDAPSGVNLPRDKTEDRPVVLRKVADVFFDSEADWTFEDLNLSELELANVSWDQLELAIQNRSKLEFELERIQEIMQEIDSVLLANDWKEDHDSE
jgi:hypothetical protein